MNQKIWGSLAIGLTLIWLFIMSQPLVGVFTGFQVLGTGGNTFDDYRTGVIVFSLIALLLVSLSVAMALSSKEKK